MQDNNNNTGIIILAAGNSSRLGKSKQLLIHRGKSLVGHVAEEAFGAGLHPVVVVTGADADAIGENLVDSPAELVYNSKWAEGLASSIVRGITHMVNRSPGLGSIILAVCDQPYVSAELFLQLIAAKEKTGKKIIASAYAGTAGTPALFDRAYYKDLLTLRGDHGAKGLFQMYPQDMATVPFEKGATDIDTKEDLQYLLKEIDEL